MTSHNPGLVRRLFSGFWRLLTWIRISLANLLFLLIILVLLAAVIPGESQKMPDRIALRIAPSGFLVDQYSYVNPLTQILQQSRQEQAETKVRDLVVALERAANDQHITSLVLELDALLGGGLSKLEEVGNALQRFKDTGKPIYAVSDNYSQEQYYLASFADEIFLHPMGAVVITGYGSYRNYFKDALDKLALNIHVFRVGEYKDAVEPYLQNKMSDASREHNSRWLHEIWNTYSHHVEEQRQLSAGSLDDYINNMDQHLQQHGGDSAANAQAAGLVDQLASREQQRQALIKRVGKDDELDDYRALDFYRYLDFTAPTIQHQSPKVGVLVAKGMILDGEQPEGSIGSDTLSQLIRNAREDDNIKALVLRIDSGGGSAFASEVIRQELETTRQAGIPVLVSMGSVAASGGYWIAMAADEVWATPTTITGSIGVFSAFPTLENSLNKLGISTDGVGTTDLAGALRLDRPLTPLTESILQQSVNHIYQRFLNLVAKARQTTPAQIHAVGQGRVWTGRAAKDLGLVDELGSLQDVIAAAANRAQLDDYQVIEVQKALSPGEQLAKQLAGNLSVSIEPISLRQSALGNVLLMLEKQLQPLVTLTQMNDPRAIYAQCLDCVMP